MRTVLKKVELKNYLISCEELRNRFLIEEDDSYIQKILDVAIDNMELDTGLSLRTKQWEVVHNNNYINLSHGPVQKIVTMKSKNKSIKPLKITRTHDNMMLKFDAKYDEITVLYEAGYSKDNLPECLKKTLCDTFYALYLKDANSQGFALDDSFKIDKYFVGRGLQ